MAAVRMTGYQGPCLGRAEEPVLHPAGRHLVAFTLQLAKPTARRSTSSTTTSARRRMARISVLRRGTRKTRLQHRLITQSDRFELDPYFGSKPVRVRPPDSGQGGQLDRRHGAHLGAAPATNLARSNWWRSSRPRGSCEPPRSLRQFALEDLREVAEFGCTYHGARLLYSVTYVPSNRVTNEAAGSKSLQPAAPSRHRVDDHRGVDLHGRFRVFDVGLLVVWLIWFFRLRDDDDDSRGDDGGGGEGPGPRPGRTARAAAASSCRWARGASAVAGCATTRAGRVRSAARPRAAGAGAREGETPELTRSQPHRQALRRIRLIACAP